MKISTNNRGMTVRNEIHEMSAVEMESVSGGTSARVRFGGHGSELSMIELQHIVSARSTLLQLTTSMMNSMHDASKTIAGNIGH